MAQASKEKGQHGNNNRSWNSIRARLGMTDNLRERALTYIAEQDRTWFDIAWERPSAPMLNALGVPRDIIAERCPVTPGWGTLLYTLSEPLSGRERQ